MLHGREEASNDRTVWMPGVPARRVSQNAAGVDPIGLRTPNPVNTARRELVAMSVTRWGPGSVRPDRADCCGTSPVAGRHRRAGLRREPAVRPPSQPAKGPSVSILPNALPGTSRNPGGGALTQPRL